MEILNECYEICIDGNLCVLCSCPAAGSCLNMFIYKAKRCKLKTLVAKELKREREKGKRKRRERRNLIYYSLQKFLKVGSDKMANVAKKAKRRSEVAW